MILAGDVGGTKTVLSLYESGVGSLEKVVEATYPSKPWASLQEIIQEFLRTHQGAGVQTACFGVPGAIINGECTTTNLPWVIRETDLKATFGFRQVRLLNDLQAAAFGMLHLPDSDLILLNPGRSLDRRRNLGVIAAGTGLGEALLVWDGERHIPMASEGGHTSFAPTDELEVELLAFLSHKHAGKGEGDRFAHVSWERVLSGPGLASVYEFLLSRGGQEGDEVIRRKAAGEDLGAVVGLLAVSGKDPVCLEAARLFCKLYGAEAGNLALKGLCTGGMFIGGGVAPKLLPVLRESGFLAAFCAKGRFAPLLAGIPVVVAKNDRAPLIGAAHFAARLS
jgi:glucokinase